MNNSTTLLVIDADTPDGVIAEHADAARVSDIHLHCLMLGSAPAMPVYAYGTPPYGGMNIPDDWGKQLNVVRTGLTARETEIEAVLGHSGVSANITSLLCATLDIKNIVALHARVCDIAYFAPNLRDSPSVLREAAQGVLFKSPIGLIMNGTPSQPIERIFVAWDSSAAAAKAVHVALPYLRVADNVTIGCFDPDTSQTKDGGDPGTDVATWLSHHGCNVTLSQFPSGGREIAQSILDRANEQGSDLIVLGAYGHSRIVQAMFGGTTQTMIDQTQQQILLAH